MVLKALKINATPVLSATKVSILAAKVTGFLKSIDKKIAAKPKYNHASKHQHYQFRSRKTVVKKHTDYHHRQA